MIKLFDIKNYKSQNKNWSENSEVKKKLGDIEKLFSDKCTQNIFIFYIVRGALV